MTLTRRSSLTAAAAPGAVTVPHTSGGLAGEVIASARTTFERLDFSPVRSSLKQRLFSSMSGQDHLSGPRLPAPGWRSCH